MGEDAFVDMQVASDLSPDDRNLAKAFGELREVCEGRGITERSLTERIKEAKELAKKESSNSSSSSRAFVPFSGSGFHLDPMSEEQSSKTAKDVPFSGSGFQLDPMS